MRLNYWNDMDSNDNVRIQRRRRVINFFHHHKKPARFFKWRIIIRHLTFSPHNCWRTHCLMRFSLYHNTLCILNLFSNSLFIRYLLCYDSHCILNRSHVIICATDSDFLIVVSPRDNQLHNSRVSRLLFRASHILLSLSRRCPKSLSLVIASG